MQNRKSTIVLITILIFALAAIFLIRAWRVAHSGVWVGSNITEKSGAQKPEKLLPSLNGSLVADEALASQRPIAVVVENHPDARPQSGLSKADLVYETLAEGGITRFLAIFQTQKAENIGPSGRRELILQK